MSLLSNLKQAKGAVHKKKRVGRGDGSGYGTTAGRGNKGQKARSGGSIRRGFEGGQMPLHRRLPKYGFKNTMFATVYNTVNLAQLEKFDGEVTPEALRKSRCVRRRGPVKVLATGTLTKSLTVKAHKFTQKAQAAIEAAGGKVEVIK
jgi:large subunit ribosomal protein L15